MCSLTYAHKHRIFFPGGTLADTGTVSSQRFGSRPSVVNGGAVAGSKNGDAVVGLQFLNMVSRGYPGGQTGILAMSYTKMINPCLPVKCSISSTYYLLNAEHWRSGFPSVKHPPYIQMESQICIINHREIVRS